MSIVAPTISPLVASIVRGLVPGGGAGASITFIDADGTTYTPAASRFIDADGTSYSVAARFVDADGTTYSV